MWWLSTGKLIWLIFFYQVFIFCFSEIVLACLYCEVWSMGNSLD